MADVEEATVAPSKDTVKNLDQIMQENLRLRRDMATIHSNWKKLVEKMETLKEMYAEKAGKVVEVEKANEELKTKNERLTVLLDLTERARNNLEMENRKLRHDLDLVLVGDQLESAESIDNTSTKTAAISTSAVAVVADDTNIENGGHIVALTTAMINTPLAVMLNSRINVLLKTCEEFKADNQKKTTDISQLKGSILRWKARVEEGEFIKNVLEKRIAVMQETNTAKIRELDGLREELKSSKSKLSALAEQLCVARERIQNLQVQTDRATMTIEDLKPWLAASYGRELELMEDKKCLQTEMLSIKKEDPAVLRRLRFEINALSGQKNHLEAKTKSIVRELNRRVVETRRYLDAMGRLQSRLEEVIFLKK